MCDEFFHCQEIESALGEGAQKELIRMYILMCFGGLLRCRENKTEWILTTLRKLNLSKAMKNPAEQSYCIYIPVITFEKRRPCGLSLWYRLCPHLAAGPQASEYTNEIRDQVHVPACLQSSTIEMLIPTFFVQGIYRPGSRIQATACLAI